MANDDALFQMQCLVVKIVTYIQCYVKLKYFLIKVLLYERRPMNCCCLCMVINVFSKLNRKIKRIILWR